MQTLNRIVDLLLLVIGGIALFLSVAYPLHLPPWRTFQNEFLFACFIVLMICRMLLSRRTLYIDFRWIGLIMLFLLAQNLRPDYLHHDYLTHLIIYTGIAWLAYTWASNQDQRSHAPLLSCVVVATTFISIVALLHWHGFISVYGDLQFFLHSDEQGKRATSAVGQSNRFASFVVISIFVCLWLSEKYKTSVAKFLFVASVFFLTQALIISQSRTGLLSLVICTMLCVFWAIASNAEDRRSKLLLSAYPLIMYLCLSGLYFSVFNLDGRLNPTSDQVAYGDPQRFRMLALGIHAITERPLFGHGPGSIQELALRLSPVYGAFDYAVLTRLHNTFLDVIVEFGLPLGITICVTITYWWLGTVFRQIKGSNGLIGIATIPLFIHALLEYPLNYGYFLWMLFWFMGLVRQGMSHRAPIKITSAATPVALTVILITSSALYFRSYIDIEKMYTQFGAGKIQEIRKAISEANYFQRLFFGELLARLDLVTLEVNPKSVITNEELKEFEYTAKRFPTYILMWRVAVANAAAGQSEKAAWWAERICHMYQQELCKAAKELWESVDEPGWPKLEWEKWLNPTSPRPGKGMN